METNFNFKSQICTDKVQSERLLALGLKKETADMCWTIDERDNIVIRLIDEAVEYIEPAWSLGRLLEILRPMMENQNEVTIPFDNTFDQIIDCIKWLIKEGHFNKEYLV